MAETTKYSCDDCCSIITEDRLIEEIPNLLERLTPGDIFPAGACPECGGLCHAEPEPMLTRYAVISYDHGEQQRYCDYVEAYTEEEAEKIVLDARGESILGVAAILDSNELHEIANELDHADGGYPSTAAELRAALGMDPEEDK